MPTSRCGSIAVVVLAALVFVAGLPPHASAQEPSGAQAVAALESAMVDAIAQAEKSVVAIARVRRGEREEALTEQPRIDPFGRLQIGNPQPRPDEPDFIPNDYATGVVIDKQGLIVTHNHVLGDVNDQYYVTTASRKVHRAWIKASDPRSDLAVLYIESHDLQPIKFGDSATLKKGQIVIALGNPYAIARDGQVSASWGIVSNLARKASPPARRNSGRRRRIRSRCRNLAR